LEKAIKSLKNNIAFNTKERRKIFLFFSFSSFTVFLLAVYSILFISLETLSSEHFGISSRNVCLEFCVILFNGLGSFDGC
jgi:hypothetical protein